MFTHKIYYIINFIKRQSPYLNVVDSALKDCLLSEEQAIAIYEAECWILRHTAFTERREKTLKLCLKILSEEKAHRSEIAVYVSRIASHKVMTALSRLGGYFLGGLFSMSPSLLNWKVHAWAELEAAKVYGRASAKLSRTESSQTLLQALKQAEQQEVEHSHAFLNLCRVERPKLS